MLSALLTRSEGTLIYRVANTAGWLMVGLTLLLWEIFNRLAFAARVQRRGFLRECLCFSREFNQYAHTYHLDDYLENWLLNLRRLAFRWQFNRNGAPRRSGMARRAA